MSGTPPRCCRGLQHAAQGRLLCTRAGESTNLQVNQVFSTSRSLRLQVRNPLGKSHLRAGTARGLWWGGRPEVSKKGDRAEQEGFWATKDSGRAPELGSPDFVLIVFDRDLG